MRNTCVGRLFSVVSVMNFWKKSSGCNWDGGEEGCCPLFWVPWWRDTMLVYVEYICANEVGDCGLCAVLINGAHDLSFKQSSGNSIDCCSVLFGGLLFYVMVVV